MLESGGRASPQITSSLSTPITAISSGTASPLPSQTIKTCCAEIVAGHQADGLRQRSNPSCQRVFVPQRIVFAGRNVGLSMTARRIVDADLVAGRGHVPHETTASLVRRVDAGKAAIGKVLQAAAEEVFGRQPGNRVVVGEHGRNAAHVFVLEKVHDGKPQLPDPSGQFLVLDAGDKAVALPGPQPGRRHFRQFAARYGRPSSFRGPGRICRSPAARPARTRATIPPTGPPAAADVE